VDNGRGCGFEDPLWDQAVGAAAQVDLIESARGDCSDKQRPSARVAGLTLLRKRYEATGHVDPKSVAGGGRPWYRVRLLDEIGREARRDRRSRHMAYWGWESTDRV
jgi:hypothetical protein